MHTYRYMYTHIHIYIYIYTAIYTHLASAQSAKKVTKAAPGKAEINIVLLKRGRNDRGSEL